MDLYDRVCTKHFIAVQALFHLTLFYSFSLSRSLRPCHLSLLQVCVRFQYLILVFLSLTSLQSCICPPLVLLSISVQKQSGGRKLNILIHHSLSSGESSCCLIPLRNILTLSHSNLFIQKALLFSCSPWLSPSSLHLILSWHILRHAL